MLCRRLPSLINKTAEETRRDGPITRTKRSPVQEAPDKTRKANDRDQSSDSGPHGVKEYASSDERQADPHQISIVSFVLL